MVKQVQGNSGKIYTYADDVPDDLIVKDIEKLEKPAAWGDVVSAVPGELKRGMGQLGAGVAKVWEDVTGQPTFADEAMAAIDAERKAQLPENMSLTQQGVMSGLASAPEMLGGLGAGLLLGSAAPLIGIGAMETLREYPEQRQGGMAPGRAALHAGVSGAGEVAGEIAPLGFAVKNLGKIGFGKLLSGFLGREVLGEELTTAWQDLNRKASIQPELTFQDWVKDAYVTGVATAVGGTTVAPAMKAADVLLKPGLQNAQPRDVSPTIEAPPSPAEPPAPTASPPKPQFTDSSAEFEQLRPLIDAVDAQLEQGVGLPTERLSEPPPAPKTTSDLMQGVEERRIADLGMTREVLNNPDNFEDTNTATPWKDRKITRGKNAQGLVGKRWGDVSSLDFDLSAGPVIIQVGQDNHVRPTHYNQGLLEDLYALAQEFNPQGVYVLLPEDTATKGSKDREQASYRYVNGMHIFTPRHMTNQTKSGSHTDKGGVNNYSPYAKLQAYSSLGHEFGHSLIQDFFFSGLSAKERMLMELGLKDGQVDTALAQKLSPAAQAVLQSWAQLRADTLSGVLTGPQAALRWLSPSKTMSKTYLKERLGFAGRNFTAQKFVQKAGLQYQLSFDEYLAEQIAKIMFDAERLAKSKTLEKTFTFNEYEPGNILAGMWGKIEEFFAPLIQTLETLHERLTARGLAEPNQSTREWLDELGKRAFEAKQVAARNTTAKSKKPTATVAPVEELPIDYSIAGNTTTLRAALKSLLSSGLVRRNSKEHRTLTGLLKQGKTAEYLDAIEPYLKKAVLPGLKFDLTEEMLDQVDRPGIKAKIEAYAARFLSSLEGFGGTVLQHPDGFGPLKGPLVSVGTNIGKNAGNSYIHLHLFTPQGFQNFIKATSLSDYQAGYIRSLMAAQDHSILEIVYSTADKGISIVAFPAARNTEFKEELIKLDPNSGMTQIVGTNWKQRLSLFGAFLARVRAFTGEYNTKVTWTRFSGAHVGKEGVAVFESNPKPTANIGYLGTGAEQQTAGGVSYTIVTASPQDALRWGDNEGAGGGLQKAGVAIRNPLVEVVTAEPSQDYIDSLINLAVAQGNDAVVLKDVPGNTGPMVLSLLRSQLYQTQEIENLPARIRFDRTTPEGEEAASRWELLRDKLHLPQMGKALSSVWNAQWSALQLQQLAHMNPQWTWLHNFASFTQKYYRKVGEMHSRADAVVRQLQNFGKENLARMYKFTTAEARGQKHWTELVKVDTARYEHRPTAELYAQMKKFGLDPESSQGRTFLNLYIEAKNALQYQMDEMQRVMSWLVAKRYSAPGQEMLRNQRLQEVAVTFALIRQTPYWPQHAFGKYVVQVWDTDAMGKVLLYEAATDSEAEAAELEAKAKAKYADKTVKSVVRTADEGLLLRLPVEFLDDLEVILGLDPNNQDDAQKIAQIRDAMHSLYSKAPTTTYDPARAFVEGGSTDFIKNFADFSLRNSNFIAKMEFRSQMQTAIAQAEQDPENQSFQLKKAEIARAISFMQDTMHYMMDPQEELNTLRGIVAIGYLWGNVKTAVLNFWGLAHLWLWMNRELGYAKGTLKFGKMVVDATRTQGHEWAKVIEGMMADSAETALRSVTDPNWEMVDGQPTELRLALEQAKSENVLDQSYAYYLATQAMRGNLARMAQQSAPGKAVKWTIDAGMSLFRGTELLIRRATFLGAYTTLQQTRPDWTPKQRYEEATKLVGLLQGDYTKGNRPRIMRGKALSFITIFMTYVQNASWNAYGGMEKGLKRQEALEGRMSPKFYRSYTAQLILLYLAMAGLEGEPGMENVLDVLDALLKKWNNGKGARELLRENLEAAGADPMQVMRGATFNLAGLDLSRSIGLGRLVPGTDTLAQEYGTTKEAIGAFTTAVSGVGGGYVQWLVDTIGATSKAIDAGTDVTGTLWKQTARLPGGLGNMFKAMQWAEYDARGPSGGLLAFDAATGKAREIQSWEIAAKALGFQPASVSEGQLVKSAQYEARAYWTTKKKVLLDAYWQAQEIARDREATADIRQAIGEFNATVPDKKFRITSESIKKSMDGRKRALKAANELSTSQKSLQGIYQQQLESFGNME